jgi:hypothetical protein
MGGDRDGERKRRRRRRRRGRGEGTDASMHRLLSSLISNPPLITWKC